MSKLCISTRNQGQRKAATSKASVNEMDPQQKPINTPARGPVRAGPAAATREDATVASLCSVRASSLPAFCVTRKEPLQNYSLFTLPVKVHLPVGSGASAAHSSVLRVEGHGWRWQAEGG